jgi:hypothetical protein
MSGISILCFKIILFKLDYNPSSFMSRQLMNIVLFILITIVILLSQDFPFDQKEDESTQKKTRGLLLSQEKDKNHIIANFDSVRSC